MNQDLILSVDRLTAGYGNSAVVHEICLQAAPGEILCLIGPNGAGKSTVLKTLMRELPPLGGTILLDDQPLAALNEIEHARRSAAVLTSRISPELITCEEVVALGRYPYTGRLGILSDLDRRRIDEVVSLVGIEDIRTRQFDRISDGQRQRVLLARALCQDPGLLILDEPTSFLDIRSKLEFMSLLRRLVRETQIAVILSLHELDLAQKFSDRILCIREGRLVAAGSPEEIFSGDTVDRLYNVEHGHYDSLFGSVEAERITAPPKVFVIGGGGSGIPVYRRLQRAGISFAAGVFPENDLDLPTARALASALFVDAAWEPVSAVRVDEALTVLRQCSAVLCPLEEFGSVNRENCRLLRHAEEHGLLMDTDTCIRSLQQLKS